MQLTICVKILFGLLLFIIFIGGIVVVNVLADWDHVVAACLLGLALIVVFTALGVFYSENKTTNYYRNLEMDDPVVPRR